MTSHISAGQTHQSRCPSEEQDTRRHRWEHRHREHHEQRVRNPVEVAHRDVPDGQLAFGVFAQVVDQIDDEYQYRKAEHGDAKDADKF